MTLNWNWQWIRVKGGGMKWSPQHDEEKITDCVIELESELQQTYREVTVCILVLPLERNTQRGFIYLFFFSWISLLQPLPHTQKAHISIQLHEIMETMLSCRGGDSYFGISHSQPSRCLSLPRRVPWNCLAGILKSNSKGIVTSAICCSNKVGWDLDRSPRGSELH